MTDELLHEGRFLRLRRRGKWEYAERVNASKAVAVVAVTSAEQILLVEQFRPAVDANVIELPAGLVGDDTENEDVLDAAGRELLEETGFRAKSLEVMASGPPSAGLGNEIVDLVRARDLTRETEGGGVEGENITVHAVMLTQVVDWLQQQSKRALIDPKVFAGLFFAGGEP